MSVIDVVSLAVIVNSSDAPVLCVISWQSGIPAVISIPREMPIAPIRAGNAANDTERTIAKSARTTII